MRLNFSANGRLVFSNRLGNFNNRLLDLLKEETSMEAIVAALEREYDAPRSVIEADVKKCLEEFEERGLLI